jgi:hypothetical protein
LSRQVLTAESELRQHSEVPVPIRDEESELAQRLAEALVEETLAGFSRRSGVPESNLRAYMKRGVKPGLDHLVAMADAANVSIEWLATGRGPRQRQAPAGATIDLDRLQRAVAAVQEGVQGSGTLPDPARYARLVAAAYGMLGTPGTAGDQVVQLIRAALA